MAIAWKWLVPFGLVLNLFGAVLVAWSGAAFMNVVENWTRGADPAKGLSIPTLGGHEGSSFAARQSGRLSAVGWILLCLGFAAHLASWWHEQRRMIGTDSMPIKHTASTCEPAQAGEDNPLAKAVAVVGALLSASQPWRRQYERTKRWHVRLAASPVTSEHRRDDFYAFFVCCYHLADWIKNDASVPEDAGSAAWQLKNRGPLGLAGDIANGFKHLVLNRPPKIDSEAHVSVVGGFHVGMPKAAPSGIVVAGKETWEDAYELADRCIKAWEAFLREHDLM